MGGAASVENPSKKEKLFLKQLTGAARNTHASNVIGRWRAAGFLFLSPFTSQSMRDEGLQKTKPS